MLSLGSVSLTGDSILGGFLLIVQWRREVPTIKIKILEIILFPFVEYLLRKVCLDASTAYTIEDGNNNESIDPLQVQLQ